MTYYKVYKKVSGKWEEHELGRTDMWSEKIAQKEVELLEIYGYEAKYEKVTE